MKTSLGLWLLAFVITAGSAVYQRMTGPTYPLRGEAALDGMPVPYTLDRSHSTSSDCVISLSVPERSVSGTLEWRRNKTSDPWAVVALERSGDTLYGALPAQPPAGKLAYRLTLMKGPAAVMIPGEPVVIRFKGDVPLAVLLTHVAAMFLGMLYSTRCGVEALRRTPEYGMKVYLSLGLLTVGGLVLGPVVQNYAFGAYWTGWPFGHDLTDNKTAAIVIAWLLAALRLRRSPAPRRWVIAAAVITLAVYLIPHSLLGSELDYSAGG